MLFFLYVILCVVIFYVFILLFPTRRKKEIRHILADLNKLKKDPNFKNKYAVAESIVFFKSMRFISIYVWWIVFRAFRLNRDNLLEISDYPFSDWEGRLHKKLLEMEKRSFPGLLDPLRKKIKEEIVSYSGAGNQILIDLGCGSMEVERQIIESLDSRNTFIFVGIDYSSVALIHLKDNLKDLISNNIVEFLELDSVNDEVLNALRSKRLVMPLIVFARNDVLELDKFIRKKADIVFYSKFRHHLSSGHKILLDDVVKKISRKVIEYDDYRSFGNMVMPSIFSWLHPPLLDGAIISRLRDPSIKELNSYKDRGWDVEYYYKIGSYTKIYNG